MNALLLRNLGGMRRASSLQSFSEYRQAEGQNPPQGAVTSEGTLLEYETLELRIHPPNVVIDNDSYDDLTMVTIDSANRPGTLIEVVQCLTELGLSIRRARISSDGGWFVDEFHVTETPKGKVVNPHKLGTIKKVLSVDQESADQVSEGLCTVFELAGRDRHGLLAQVLSLLHVNGCEVLSAAVWTFHKRVALVVSCTERGQPLVDPIKLQRLTQILRDILGSDNPVVHSSMVKGQVHHERRLHHLLLLEELAAWQQQNPRSPRNSELQQPPQLSASSSNPTESARAAVTRTISLTDHAARLLPLQSLPSLDPNFPDGHTLSPVPSVEPPILNMRPSDESTSSQQPPSVASTSSIGNSLLTPAPTGSLSFDMNFSRLDNGSTRAEVKIMHSSVLNYWLVTCLSKDRNKLFFDTVCTLADMNYDIYHATIDSEGDNASQLFYVRPRYGECIWNPAKARQLQYMLESAVQRRFPRGLKVHVQSDGRNDLLQVFQALSNAGFWITRADVRTFADYATYEFTLTDIQGQMPEKRDVQRTCEAVGGTLVDDLDMAAGGTNTTLPSRPSPGHTQHPPPTPAVGLSPASTNGGSSAGSAGFKFSFLEKKWNRGWQGMSTSSTWHGAGAALDPGTASAPGNLM